MATHVILAIDSIRLRAELNDSPGAQAIVKQLPLTITMSRWGDEYYGNCGVDLQAAPDARQVMGIGELAFWPPGNALCIFFGPTPASRGDEPRAASEVNPVGRLLDDPSGLKNLGPTVTAQIELE